MRNRLLANLANLATIAMLGSGSSFLASPAYAQTQPTLEEHSTAFVNEQRSERGFGLLKTDAQLTSAARRHAERMAADAEIYHNSDLGREVDGFERLGENVGVGWSVEAIDESFMESDGHRRNILGSFTRIGLGVVEREGDIYVVQVFGRQAPKSKPSAQEPEREKKAKPKPKHKKHNHAKHQHAKPKPRPSSTPTQDPQPTPSASPEPTPSQEPTSGTAAEPTPDPTVEPTPDPTVEPSPDPSEPPTADPADSPSPEPIASGGKSFPLPGWLTR